jgi:hypothetical protein
MQFATELVLDAQIPAVNVLFFLPFQLSLAVMARRMIAEAVKERLDLITCINDLVHGATQLGLLDHHLPTHRRSRELSQSSRLKPLAR